MLIVYVLPVGQLFMVGLHRNQSCVVVASRGICMAARSVFPSLEGGLIIGRSGYICEHLLTRGANVIGREGVVDRQLYSWARPRCLAKDALKIREEHREDRGRHV